MNLLADIQLEFREWLELTAGKPGVTVSSFERGPRFAGDQSQHQLALAADFIGDLVELQNIATDARAQGFIPVWESDHLHVQRFRAGFLRSCGLV